MKTLGHSCKLGTSMMLKELVWKLDREVWSKVPTEIPIDQAWTTSKAREESARLITEYFGSVDDIKPNQEKAMKIRNILKVLEKDYGWSFFDEKGKLHITQMQKELIKDVVKVVELQIKASKSIRE